MGGQYGVKTQTHDFSKKLAFSNGANAESDMERIKYVLGRACAKVEKTDIEADKTGIDYVATLRGGATVNVDAKRREKGASRYWKNGEPELAIETYSVYDTKYGWTFSTSSLVDYILYSFEPEDCNDYFFLPFQLLRKAACDNVRKIGDKILWNGLYIERKQFSGDWESRCIFVPASVVISAITEQMTMTA